MPEKPYQNREIDEMFEDIKSSLTRIEEQTKRTNGRVTHLEHAMLIILTLMAVFVTSKVPVLSTVFASFL